MSNSFFDLMTSHTILIYKEDFWKTCFFKITWISFIFTKKLLWYIFPCPCSARGAIRKGHRAQGAWWWSRLFHINRVSNFSRESISSNCILDKQIIIFSISLNILPELKLSEHETNMIILTFSHFFFILLLQSRHFELTRVYCIFFFN